MSTASKKVKKIKTPIQNALEMIKLAYIAAFISAAITMVFVIISFVSEPVIVGIDAFALIDVAFIIVLAVLLMKLKSRVASIVLLVYYISGHILLRIENPGISSYLTVFFVIMFLFGIWGTFSYHNIKSQESDQESKENIDANFTEPTAAIRMQTPKGRVLIAQAFENLEIIVKRSYGVTELIVNEMVYAERQGIIELNYELRAYVENVFIKVVMDSFLIIPTMYLYVNDNLVAAKKRIV